MKPSTAHTMFGGIFCVLLSSLKTNFHFYAEFAAAAKPLQSCPTLCYPIGCSLPGSSIPGILQARMLEWVAICFSNAWKWSRSGVSDSSQPHRLQPTRFLRPWGSPGKRTGVGCHCLLCMLFRKSLMLVIKKSGDHVSSLLTNDLTQASCFSVPKTLNTHTCALMRATPSFSVIQRWLVPCFFNLCTGVQHTLWCVSHEV